MQKDFLKKANVLNISMLHLTKERSHNQFDPNNYCTVKWYRKHLQRVHKMKLPPTHPTPKLAITPNLDNLNNHCDSCIWTYSSKQTYRYHLELVHKINIFRVERIALNPNISPDIVDPNNYCKSCRKTY